MILLWSTLALGGAPCPSVGSLVGDAQAAFDDAEVDLAREKLGAAAAALSCQQVMVPRQTLLDLYQLDALASVAAEDRKAALYAIIRAVTLDPGAAPPADVGPELMEQHRQWAQRLGQDRVLVRSSDADSTVWIDGQALGAQAARVIAGEHLVQVRGPDGWHSGVVELAVGRDTGFPLIVSAQPQPVASADPGIAPTPEPAPAPRAARGGIAATGVVLALAGAGLAVGGYALEQRFHSSAYAQESYGGCDRSQACWTTARADRIAADARTTNGLYLSGYGLAGVGAGIVGIELIVARTAGGR